VLENIAPLKYIYNWKSRNKHRCAMANAGKTVFAQFPKTRSIHRGFSNRKMKDNYQQKSSLHFWQLIPNFFIAPLPIFVRRKTKDAAEAVYAIGHYRFLIALVIPCNTYIPCHL
jgi:hypothetical protein